MRRVHFAFNRLISSIPKLVGVCKNDIFRKPFRYRYIFMGACYTMFFGTVKCTLADHELSQSTIPNVISAIQSNNLQYVIKELNKGLDINLKCFNGWNFLHVAVISQNKEMVKLLLEMGADPNCVDEYPGARRASARNHKNLNTLIRERLTYFTNTLNPYADYTGFTPLHYAAFLNNEEIIKILIEGGANPILVNSNNESPADLCLVDDTKKVILNAVTKLQNESLRNKISTESLKSILETNLVGQRFAISAVSNAILRKLSGWCLQDGPLVLLFLGSSGVGKTETAKLVAKYVTNDNKKGFIRLDMSEYQEKHQVARMIGSPPGYIGYEEGGQLTKLLKETPNAIVLLDEIEKAHPDVLTILLQLFDEGRITDSKGETICASNAIFIMTSNLGSEVIRKHAASLRNSQNDNDRNGETISFSRDFKNNYIYPILKRNLKRDEFLGRINEIIYFIPFSPNELRELAALQLDRTVSQIKDKHSINLTYTTDVLDVIASGFDPIYGARSIQNQVEIVLLNRLAQMFISGELDHVKNIHVSVDKDDGHDSLTIVTTSDDKSQPTANGIYSKITSLLY